MILLIVEKWLTTQNDHKSEFSKGVGRYVFSSDNWKPQNIQIWGTL